MKTIIVLVLFLAGCSATYTSYTPSRVNYGNHHVSNGVEFSYTYDVLNTLGNSRYASYEKDEHINIIAVKVKNTRNEDISFTTDNLKLLIDNANKHVMSPERVSDDMSQNVWTYLLWSLVTLNINTETSSSTYPIGIPIALFNVIGSSSANSKFGDDLENYNIYNTKIKANETKYFFIGVQYTNYNPIKFEFNPN